MMKWNFSPESLNIVRLLSHSLRIQSVKVNSSAVKWFRKKKTKKKTRIILVYNKYSSTDNKYCCQCINIEVTSRKTNKTCLFCTNMLWTCKIINVLKKKLTVRTDYTEKTNNTGTLMSSLNNYRVEKLHLNV